MTDHKYSDKPYKTLVPWLAVGDVQSLSLSKSRHPYLCYGMAKMTCTQSSLIEETPVL
jgi:hypothetical protein